MPTASALAGTIAAYTKHGGPDDPRIPDVRRALAEMNLTRAITTEVEKAPPLRQDQIDRLAALLKRDVS